MERAHGPTIPRIARECPIRMLPCPTAMEVGSAKIYNLAVHLRAWRSLAALAPHQEESGWALGRLRLAGIAALSVEFGTAARRGCKATTDSQASARPGAEED